MSWAGMWTPTFRRPAGNFEKKGNHFALKCWQQPSTLQES